MKNLILHVSPEEAKEFADIVDHYKTEDHEGVREKVFRVLMSKVRTIPMARMLFQRARDERHGVFARRVWERVSLAAFMAARTWQAMRFVRNHSPKGGLVESRADFLCRQYFRNHRKGKRRSI